MLKKIMILISCLALSLTMASCSKKEETTATTKKATTIESTTTEGSAYRLTCTVLLPDGSPAIGCQVQWCEEVCLVPVTVDENGTASTTAAKESKTYDIHILKCPTGYTFNPFALKMSKENTTETYTLLSLNEIEGEGTKASPAKITTGNYSVYLEDADELGAVYYYIQPTEAGEYEIESFAYVAEGDDDTLIYYYGNDLSNPTAVKGQYNDNDGNNNNFKYSFTVTAEQVESNTPFIYRISAKGETKFLLTVTKK